MIKITLRKAYIPVKTYAGKHKLTVKAVYKRVKTGRLKVKRLGTYTLGQDK
jgi:hypothetical protein